MEDTRRRFLTLTAQAAIAAAAGQVSGWGTAEAADWNKAGFQAKAVQDALKSIGATTPVDSRDILIKAPDIAENGAAVPVEVTSRIPNTQSISIIADKNPFPLVASFDFANGAEPYASTRVKIGQTTNVRAIVKADGKYYAAMREVKVTIGGCGG